MLSNLVNAYHQMPFPIKKLFTKLYSIGLCEALIALIEIRPGITNFEKTFNDVYRSYLLETVVH